MFLALFRQFSEIYFLEHLSTTASKYIFSFLRPSRHFLLVESQQWKHQSSVWNLFRVYSKNTWWRQLAWSFYWFFEHKVSPFWLWANKCRVEWYSRHENLSFSVIISTFVMTLYHLTIWSHISPPWVFFTFLKYATDTKSRNASHIFKRNI